MEVSWWAWGKTCPIWHKVDINSTVSNTVIAQHEIWIITELAKLLIEANSTALRAFPKAEHYLYQTDWRVCWDSHIIAMNNCTIQAYSDWSTWLAYNVSLLLDSTNNGHYSCENKLCWITWSILQGYSHSIIVRYRSKINFTINRKWIFCVLWNR